MYDYIMGKVTRILNNAIVLDNNGIGYLIHVSNPYSFEIGNEYKVFVYQQIMEDEHLLYGFKTIEEPAKFLNWLTFDYEVRRDHTGSPVVEKPFGFEILIFKDERNRKEFWGEVQLLLYTYGRMMSMQDIAKMVICKRRSSVVLRD